MYKLKYTVNFKKFAEDNPSEAKAVKNRIDKYFDVPHITKSGEWYISENAEYLDALTLYLYKQRWAVKYLEELIIDYGTGEYDMIEDFKQSHSEEAEKWQNRV